MPNFFNICFDNDVCYYCFDRPYAPCLLGFEGRGGNRTPTIRGIVVHEHNAELLREAHMEMASQMLEQSHENRQHDVYKKWNRLLVGVLTKDRLERAYGGDDDDDQE
jgi:hypothetical protein